MSRLTFHLLPNAHLDPVWLWDWREGLNEGIITTRTVLDMLDEFPELTFMRGEALLYRHIEENDPQLFKRLTKAIEAGRWEIVGGTWVQPDTNMPSTEVFARHLLLGKSYFRKRFGKDVKVAWAADSFGHSAGLPDILTAAGMEAYSFSRTGETTAHLKSPAFWWEAESGARILAYRCPTGCYTIHRNGMNSVLDATLKFATESPTKLENWGVYVGLGNHGGGTTRRHIMEAREWAKKHPEVNVIYSGLHRLVADLKKEDQRKGGKLFPAHRGEMNFCLRGCYASQAHFKTLYRKSESLLARAETVSSAVSAATGKALPVVGDAWESVLFNSFHDILPGSSIERAYDDQTAWIGGAIHHSQKVELAALNALASQVNTQVPPPAGPDKPSAVALMVFNPNPFEYRGPLEVEAHLDYCPLWQYYKRQNECLTEVRGPDRRPVAHQQIQTEHSCFPYVPWRKRIVTNITLPPTGWGMYEIEWKEKVRNPVSGKRMKARSGTIDNGIYNVSAQRGGRGVSISHRGRKVFDGAGLHFVTVNDPWGSWGMMEEKPEFMNLSDLRYQWKIKAVEARDCGTERAELWVRLTGGHSRIDLQFVLHRGYEAVDVSARLTWDERSARLKMVMPAGDKAEFEVPGGTAKRGPVGEAPGGRWVRIMKGRRSLGFASNALYCFDCTDGAVRATLVRATRSGNDVKTEYNEDQWRPASDVGEHRFKMVFSPGKAELPMLSASLERPLITVPVKPHTGPLPRSGSLFETDKSTVLHALKPAENGKGWILRLQNTEKRTVVPVIRWMRSRMKLTSLAPSQIGTWRLIKAGKRWLAESTSITETRQ